MICYRFSIDWVIHLNCGQSYQCYQLLRPRGAADALLEVDLGYVRPICPTSVPIPAYILVERLDLGHAALRPLQLHSFVYGSGFGHAEAEELPRGFGLGTVFVEKV